MHPNGWQCRRCTFWFPMNASGSFDPDYNRTPTGQCRRDPPVPTAEGQNIPRRPPTNSEDWCGRFETRVDR
jgi:hypothetical protein